jgi:hypothetical protein
LAGRRPSSLKRIPRPPSSPGPKDETAMAQLLFWAFMLFLVVEALTGIYVAIKYGPDMIGSHLHFVLAFDWTRRIIVGLAICYGLLLLKLMYILDMFFFQYAVLFFKAIFNATWVIITA